MQILKKTLIVLSAVWLLCFSGFAVSAQAAENSPPVGAVIVQAEPFVTIAGPAVHGRVTLPRPESGAAAYSLVSPYWSTVSNVTVTFFVENGDAYFLITVSGYSSITSFTIDVTIEKKFLLWWNENYAYPTYTVSKSSGYMERERSVGSGTFRLDITVTTYKNGVKQETIPLTVNE